MKKITAALTALAVIAGLVTSCQKEMEHVQEPSDNDTGLKVTAIIAHNGTRVSYHEDNTDHSLQPSWEEGDIIIGFDGDGKTYGYKVTAVNDGVATLTIIKDGDYKGSSASDPANSTTMYMFYAPGTKPSAISNKSLTVSIASQDKDIIPALMMAQATVTDGSLTLQFHNQISIIGIKTPKMTFNNKSYTSLALTGSADFYTGVKFYLDGDNKLQASYQTPGTLTKELAFTSDSETGNGPDVVYMVVCPAEKQNLSFKFNGTGTQEYFNVNGVAIAEGNYYRLESPATRKQIFAITITDGITGGTVSTDPSGSVAWGTDVTITATPTAGYVLNAIEVMDADGNSVPVTDGNKFAMPMGDVTVSVTFKAQVPGTITYYNITDWD